MAKISSIKEFSMKTYEHLIFRDFKRFFPNFLIFYEFF